jgi:pimeloyl-ACP methyl ester carboxylesterase
MPTLEARGVEIAWSERGDGSPVLLIHETAATGAIWEPVAGSVSERSRAIFYDRRGWGRSSAPEGYRRTTVEEQSEDAVTLIEQVAGEPTVVCGASLGAVIALDLLLRRADAVSAAVLIEPPLLQLLPVATEALSDDRRRLEGAAAAGEDVIELYLSGGLPALGAGVGRLPESMATVARDRPASVMAELGIASGWRAPLARLATAERPSAIVTADSTPPLLRDASSALGGRLARSSSREVDSAARAPHVGAAEQVAALLLELSRQAEAAPPAPRSRRPGGPAPRRTPKGQR